MSRDFQLRSLEYYMRVKLLTDHHLEFLILKEGCTGSPESTLIKMLDCWKSHFAGQLFQLVKTMQQKFMNYGLYAPV